MPTFGDISGKTLEKYLSRDILGFQFDHNYLEALSVPVDCFFQTFFVLPLRLYKLVFADPNIKGSPEISHALVRKSFIKNITRIANAVHPVSLLIVS